MKLLKSQIISFIVLVSIMTLSLNAFAIDIFYIVKKGDTLSDILFKKSEQHIYGKRGALIRILKLNPQIKIGDGNKLKPNMKIYLIYSVPTIPMATETAEVAIELGTVQKKITSRVPSNEFNQSFFWEISPTLSWKSLSSTDENVYRRSQINALSNTSFGVSVSYGMHFEEKVDLYSKLFLESVSYVGDSSINLLKKKFLASRFGMGFSYDKKWLLEFAMGDEFFLTSPSLLNVDIKKVTLPEIKGSYLKDFYQHKEAKLFYLLSANAFLPRSSPELNSKLSYGAAVAVGAKLRNQAFVIGFEEHFLKATGNSTNYQNIFWNYVWETL